MSNVHPLSIKQNQSFDVKALVKAKAGRVASACFPFRTRQLYRQPINNPSALTDKLILYYLRKRCLLENRTRFFERLHKEFWSGKGGSMFSSNCDHRFDDLFIQKQRIEFEQVVETWTKHGLNKIVEFGCNSGLLLNYLTKNLSSVETSIGLEINAEQVARNQQSDAIDKRIQFVLGDAGDWLLKNGTDKTLYVSNGGVLEYFRRERLDEMLSYIANNCKPAVFFAVEPVADDHDFELQKKSIPFGEELSFSHNYTDLFTSNGFTIVHQRAVTFESWKMLATIAEVNTV